MDNKDNVKTLLMLYEQHPILYAVKSADYHNRTKRDNAYRLICQQYEECTHQYIPMESAKKKINNLRSQYLDCLNKIKASKTSGASSDDIYKPTWWLFEDMQFLDPHIAQRKGESSITVSNKLLDSSQSSIIAEESDSEDLQFLDVTNILRTEDSDKENIESNNQLALSSSSSSTQSYSEMPQHKQRKRAKLDDNSEKEKFWTVATNAIQTMSKSNDSDDELQYWILYLKSKLRKITEPKKLNKVQKRIIEYVDEENDENE